jgi:hypothetical protein
MAEKSYICAKASSGRARVRFASGRSTLKIPLEIDNNIILMQVRVNRSKPLKFIFDTGWSYTAIDSKQ